MEINGGHAGALAALDAANGSIDLGVEIHLSTRFY